MVDQLAETGPTVTVEAQPETLEVDVVVVGDLGGGGVIRSIRPRTTMSANSTFSRSSSASSGARFTRSTSRPSTKRCEW